MERTEGSLASAKKINACFAALSSVLTVWRNIFVSRTDFLSPNREEMVVHICLTMSSKVFASELTSIWYSKSLRWRACSIFSMRLYIFLVDLCVHVKFDLGVIKWIFTVEYIHIPIRMMQDFENFEKVCRFFILSDLDPTYVKRIDELVKSETQNPDRKSTLDVVKRVRAFHDMRHDLCSKIFNRVERHGILNALVKASGVEQYDKIPAKSSCALTGERLNNGLLLMLRSNGELTPYVVHARYKRLLYIFWSIVHFPQQLMLGVRKWVDTKSWWTRGGFINTDVLERVIAHKDNIFIKSAYVKLKDICHYIQIELTATPINVRDHTTG
jgi:hypothetical protein